MRKRNPESGNHTLEFTLVGLPLTFLLFSIANMSLSMLTLHTLQEAVEQGTRYMVTRGTNCTSGTNSCSVTVQQIASVVATQAVGIPPSQLNLTLIPNSDNPPTVGASSVLCKPISVCLASCSSGCSGSRTTVWPPSANSNNATGATVALQADATVTGPMFMFWQGSVRINGARFGAYSQQKIAF
jgi:Flp pilus assembly protein TadG